MKMMRNIPAAGHLGSKKMTKGVKAQFYLCSLGKGGVFDVMFVP